ncbi:N-acetylglucosamine transport system substrate-binding protein [Micromonospora phaseoli]|uniref:N-acetylglucosamine transport system substrate-binding protein n=1 Tax=Micromonospora phaseoli TaxID=1144548 RepID=A0A1H7DN62_9ACTN|nr:N-acetylglucosamine/diacetylchitobiose ABC transporter substrate-binding protein [Micromonospora phaseoli]PZV89488.1 N-acetylglucosamine transport system substrate-binding protein [Micromonospora phaseoli]GIJ80598.1 carbohydrate ABC transporter, N-acetylglucosamine/diacetylchitobiose-binding protein [Micromonospora phaseoli]SEK03213.1 N-acetylglucosamine transport system substrate-binding protein [Micromonospora phaseoli]
MNRRDILRRTAAAGLLATPAAGLLTGCATSGGGDDAGESYRGTKSEANPLGVAEDAPLEVVIFNGGFGEEYAKAHQAMYTEKYPQAKINHSATQEISKTLQPRFVDGTPPDVVNNSGAGQIDFNGLVSQNALADLGELLDAPSLDIPGQTVRETLLPGAVEVGSYDGRFLVMNYTYTVYGIWHSTKLFADRGWAYATTWDEHIALCRQIKAAGIAPWTYAGIHPRYMSWPLISTAIKFGGPEVATAIDNLEPNAWRSEAMRMAADAWHQIVKDRYILEGSPGLDHKQSQTAWCQGKAAFVSCGSWLESEQADVTPAGFDMTVQPTPRLGAGDKLPYEAIRGTAGEPFMVPAKAKNIAGGLEYFRTMLSRRGAQDFTRKVASLTVVAGATEGVQLPYGLTTVVKALDASGANGFNWVYNNYYRKLERNLVDAACGEFFSGRVGPAEFLDQCQKGADSIAQDSSITKYKRAA